MIHSEMIIDKGYSDINPLLFGFEKCQPAHSFGPALRTYWLLHFVVLGKGIFKIRDREYSVKAGSIFVIPPFIETYYQADFENPWEYIWVGFTMSDRVVFNFDDVIYVPKASSIFEDMTKCKKLNEGKTEYLCAKIWQLISLLSDKQDEKVNHIEKALNIIHSEYMNEITVKNIADRLNLERTYFSDLFKREIGISPKKYLLNYRMQQALSLLKNHNLSVSVTALSVGYTDVYIFSKMFKRHFGVAPSKYKET